MKIWLKVLAACFVLCNIAMAVNLGSYARHESVSISGGSAVFEILFWTSEDYNVSISLYSENKPSGWDIEISPSNFYTNKEAGSEIMVLENNVMRKATLVKVKATPSSYVTGNYSLKVVAEAGSPSSWMSSFQERVFNFNVKITPPPTTRANHSDKQNSAYGLSTTTTQEPENTNEPDYAPSKGNADEPSGNSLAGNIGSSLTGMLISGETADALILLIFAASIIILLICAAKILRDGF